MASFKYSTFFKAARKLGVFLNLEAGLTRNPAEQPAEGSPTEELEKARNRIAEQQRRLQNKEREIDRLKGAGSDSATTEDSLTERDIVWVFGSARTGSTWLASMLSELRGYKLWNEPHVGRLFGKFYYEDETSQRRRDQRNYIMGGFKEPWLKSIRHFVLEGAQARFPRLPSRGRVVIKEPNASIGAPLLSEALPGSCLILLVRDPRDAVASSLDRWQAGGLLEQWKKKDGRNLPDRDPEELARQKARKYLAHMSKSKEAYEAHEGPKALVRYEDLRADPPRVMKRLCADLELGAKDEEIAQAVEKHSWENIPEDKKGEGEPGRLARRSHPRTGADSRGDYRTVACGVLPWRATPREPELTPKTHHQAIYRILPFCDIIIAR